MKPHLFTLRLGAVRPMAVVVAFIAAGPAMATLSLTDSSRFRLSVRRRAASSKQRSTSAASTASSQERLSQRLNSLYNRQFASAYGAFFGVEGQSPPPNSTRTFCSTA
jgi:hypothetical protein